MEPCISKSEDFNVILKFVRESVQKGIDNMAIRQGLIPQDIYSDNQEVIDERFMKLIQSEEHRRSK